MEEKDPTPIYSESAMEYIMAFQKGKLLGKYGPTFEDKLDTILKEKEPFDTFLERMLSVEFGDKYDDTRFEMEAILKSEAIEPIPNLTKYEFPSHRRIVNWAESIFKKAIEGRFQINIPYIACLNSKSINAEIVDIESLDRPIIFFHSELFIANLLLVKLYAQIIPYKIEEDDLKYYYDKEFIQAKIAPITPRIIEFHNAFITSWRNLAPSYFLSSTMEFELAEVLLESIYLFIFSHEVGHSEYSHHKLKDPSTEQLHQAEFEADLYALNRIVELYRKTKDPFILLGPVIFFKYQMIMEANDTNLAEIDTHPKSSDRLENYLIFLGNFIHGDEKKLIDKYITLEDNISTEILKVLIQYRAFIIRESSRP